MRPSPSVPGDGSGRSAGQERTIRARSIEATWEALAQILPARGITRLADLTGLDILGIPVYSAFRPGAATLVASAGKGVSHTAARVSAVMESLEVAAAEEYKGTCVERGPASLVRPGYSVRDLALHPKSLVDDQTELGWTVGTDLVSGAECLIPDSAIGLVGWSSEIWHPCHFLSTTNGLAAGNNTTEAAVHGLLEIIERDALARLLSESRSSIDLSQLKGQLGELITKIRESGSEIELEEIPSLPGTFTFLCYLFQDEMYQVFAGSGSYVSPEIAAERAVLEAAQSRVSVVSGARDDLPSWSYKMAASFGSSRRTAVRPSVHFPDAVPLPRTLEALYRKLVLAITAHTGSPVICVELSSAINSWPKVVQVIAPGMLPAPAVPPPPYAERLP